MVDMELRLGKLVVAGVWIAHCWFSPMIMMALERAPYCQAANGSSRLSAD